MKADGSSSENGDDYFKGREDLGFVWEGLRVIYHNLQNSNQIDITAESIPKLTKFGVGFPNLTCFVQSFPD